jgi:hypothetical protein
MIELANIIRKRKNEVVDVCNEAVDGIVLSYFEGKKEAFEEVLMVIENLEKEAVNGKK